MKRLLVYNQLPDFTLEHRAIKQMNLQIEEVNSISEVFKRHLFHVTTAGDLKVYDAFIVHVNEPTREIVEFLGYIRKTKPELPLIILSKSIEKTLILKNLLRGMMCHFSESDQLDYIFDQLTSSLPTSG